jgi:hypothetical protein
MMRCVKSRINRDYEEKFFKNKLHDGGNLSSSQAMLLDSSFDPSFINSSEMIH